MTRSRTLYQREVEDSRSRGVLAMLLEQLLRQGLPTGEVCVHAACLRLRPVLMTASGATLGMTPLLFATGTGGEVHRPLATVVVGGFVTSTILTLPALQAICRWFGEPPKEAGYE